MTTRLTILILLIGIKSFAATDSLRISGNIYRCDQNQKDAFGRGLWICQGDICKEVPVYSGGRFYIIGLRTGQYQIKYGNVWNQTLLDSVNITQNIGDYKVCIDKFLKRDSYPMLELYNQSKTIEIKQYSSGCFHTTEEFIKIDKTKKDYIVTFKTDKKDKTRQVHKNEELKSLEDFLRKIDLMNLPGGCTTTDRYEIVFDTKVIEIEDSSCDWNGFEKLRQELFGVK